MTRQRRPKTESPVPAGRKVQSVEDFLAKGGKITRVPEKELDKQITVIKKTTAGGPAIFLTLDEADLLYGEPSKRKPKKAKPALKIDLDALPPALRAKFIAKLREETDGEGYEEELEEAEGSETADEEGSED